VLPRAEGPGGSSPGAGAITEGALLALDGVARSYVAGDQTVHALRGVSLSIAAGEMVAIMGSSGSGKSTLLNILGCLDQPDAGTYRVAGEATSTMSADELSRLRREHFGFIFQRYQLLDDLSALRNVEMPAIYAGMAAELRHERATTLLTRLGLGERLAHRPNELSGGQQQRVSIARALVNGGQVILADEPTGALDAASGAEVLRILQELHRDGHTVIVVTHDAAVAAHAERIIELRDGLVVADRATASASRPSMSLPSPMAERDGPRWVEWLGQAGDSAVMAARNMAGHRMRTLLTMLGIVIGITSVVSVTAVGEGSRREVMTQLRSLGTNIIDLNPGRGFGDQRAGTKKPLTPGDAHAIAALDYVDSVSPVVFASSIVRRGNVERTATIRGVGAAHFHVRGFALSDGQAFDARSVATQAQDAVIDEQTRLAFFADGTSPLGQAILLGSVPVRVVGVVQRPKSPFLDNGLVIYVPYTTALTRLSGAGALSSITLRVRDGVPTKVAESGIRNLLKQRHGSEDFFVNNTESFRQTIAQSEGALSLLISAIALISLIVGGIGVMNIMLVTVSERTQEIGIRMAVGARRADILRQFLIEAVLVCVLGGIVGIALSIGIAAVTDAVAGSSKMPISGSAIGLAFLVSSTIGVVFGYLPARKASRLNPIEALARL
jgi:macrolide transport system ATP-binding/permease protein